MRHKDDAEQKRKHTIFSMKIILTVTCILLIGGMLLSVKPIRRIVMTYYIRVISLFEHTRMNETPNIALDELSIRAIEPEKNVDYTFIKKSVDDVHKGDLILVNSGNIYSFLEQDNLISLNKNKNKAYKLIDKDMQASRKMVQALNKMMRDFESATGKHDMIITSAYRSLKEQEEAFEEKVNEFGQTDALKWAMLPGYSEHHTGDAVDMSIRTDDEVYINYKGQNEYAWINQNCFKYGIIRRYTEDKIAITGISNEPWHYRYVGIPHAYLMTLHKFCLEEYIDYIRNYTFNTEHLLITTEEGSYEIYYVPIEENGDTMIPVPQNEIYTISGDNSEGFIVTIDLKDNQQK